MNLDEQYLCAGCGRDLSAWARTAQSPYLCPGCGVALDAPEVQSARRQIKGRDAFALFTVVWVAGMILCWFMGWEGPLTALFFLFIPVALVFFITR